jgi:hypothetical protein
VGQHVIEAVITVPGTAQRYVATVDQLVNRAPLAVRVAADKPLGAPVPGFTPQFVGLVLGEGPAVVAGQLSFTTTATQVSPVGTYPITFSTPQSPTGPLAVGNYDVTLTTGQLVVFEPLEVRAVYATQVERYRVGLRRGNDQPPVPAEWANGVLRVDANRNGAFEDNEQTFFGRPAEATYDGDQFFVGVFTRGGPDVVAVFGARGSDPAGYWSIDLNGDGKFDPADGDIVLRFGLATDIGLVGDWNNDGVSELGVARDRGNGRLTFSFDINGNGIFDSGDAVFEFGTGIGTPVVGDWNGDGTDDIGLFYRSSSVPFLRFELDRDGDRLLGSQDAVVTFGRNDDVVLVYDYDGDGKDDLGALRLQNDTAIYSFAYAKNEFVDFSVYGSVVNETVAAAIAGLQGFRFGF